MKDKAERKEKGGQSVVRTRELASNSPLPLHPGAVLRQPEFKGCKVKEK